MTAGLSKAVAHRAFDASQRARKSRCSAVGIPPVLSRVTRSSRGLARSDMASVRCVPRRRTVASSVAPGFAASSAVVTSAADAIRRMHAREPAIVRAAARVAAGKVRGDRDHTVELMAYYEGLLDRRARAA